MDQEGIGVFEGGHSRLEWDFVGLCNGLDGVSPALN